jgi:molybdopterin synthase catalytic subunit
MRIRIRLFARLRELAGDGGWTSELPSGSSVADVWRAVTARHPALEPFGRSISAAVNEDFAPMHAAVQDSDEVAFLPPVSGGDGSKGTGLGCGKLPGQG